MSRQQQKAPAAQIESLWIQQVLIQAQRYAYAADAEKGQQLTELHSLMCFSPAAALLQRMLSPSDLGHAVSAEVRDLVRQVLGMEAVETPAATAVQMVQAQGGTFEDALHAGRYTRPDGMQLLLEDLEEMAADMVTMRDQARRALQQSAVAAPTGMQHTGYLLRWTSKEQLRGQLFDSEHNAREVKPFTPAGSGAEVLPCFVPLSAAARAEQ